MTNGLDYRTAFDLAPIGLVLSRNRLIVDCNQQVLEMFGAHRDELVGRSFELLYPSHAEFERTGARIVASLSTSGWYADERVMKRLSGPGSGEHFFSNLGDERRPICVLRKSRSTSTVPSAAIRTNFENRSRVRVRPQRQVAKKYVAHQSPLRRISGLLISSAQMVWMRSISSGEINASPYSS